MIALTQEKREELANYARARLASHVVHGGCSDEEDIFKIALASLTAEPIAHADSKAILKMLKGYTRFFTSFPERSETKRVDLFTAPPVPEIKLATIEDLVKGLKVHGLRNSVQGVSPASDCFKCGFTWYEKEIKRLNGLGGVMVTLSILNFAIVCGLLGAGIICAFILIMLAIGGHIRT